MPSHPVFPSVSEQELVPATTPQQMTTSSDLFEGELFGDELVDIYNAAVEGSAEGEMVARVCRSQAE